DTEGIAPVLVAPDILIFALAAPVGNDVLSTRPATKSGVTFAVRAEQNLDDALGASNLPAIKPEHGFRTLPGLDEERGYACADRGNRHFGDGARTQDRFSIHEQRRP